MDAVRLNELKNRRNYDAAEVKYIINIGVEKIVDSNLVMFFAQFVDGFNSDNLFEIKRK